MKSMSTSHVGSSQVEANKKLVLDFYELAFNKKDISAAVAYLDDNIIQHHPQVSEGKQGSIDAFNFFLKQTPTMKATVKKVIAEGDLVVLHVFMQPNPNEPNDRGMAVVDIFRVENGKIKEHWDVIQPIPETAANNNTMF